jgi:hypothetical protein
MTKAAPTLTEPTTIAVAQGVVLKTTIDPHTKRHLLVCDICKKTIRLTKSANPNAFFEHRKFCAIREAKKSADYDIPDTPTSTSRSSNTLQSQYSLSGLATSFSHLQTASPMPSPIARNTQVDFFSIPTVHKSRWVKICPGIGVSWLPGSVWETYPYHQHATRAVGWTPIGFDSEANKIFIRSDNCANQLFEEDAAPCTRCLMVEHSVEFKSFISRATEAKEHTPWNYLTSEQLLGLLEKMAGKLNFLRTKVHFISSIN